MNGPDETAGTVTVSWRCPICGRNHRAALPGVVVGETMLICETPGIPDDPGGCGATYVIDLEGNP